MQSKFFCAVFLLVFGSQAHCTTIIFRRDGSDILVAADTRGSLATGDVIAGLAQFQNDVNDRTCKIVPLTNAAFAVTGAIDYHRGKLDDLDDWNSFDDAKVAAKKYGDNLNMVAADWALHSVSHYQAFYIADPQRVADIVKGHSHILELGQFFYWQDGTPKVLVKIIEFDPDQPSPIFSEERVVTITDKELSTNDKTQELIDGKTAAARKVSAEWAKYASKLAPGKSARKHLQFLIEATSKMDKSVSSESDILKIPEKGTPNWISTSGCKKQGSKLLR
jgi:hypothetical protein